MNALSALPMVPGAVFLGLSILALHVRRASLEHDASSEAPGDLLAAETMRFQELMIR